MVFFIRPLYIRTGSRPACHSRGGGNLSLHLERKESVVVGVSVLYVRSNITHREIIAQFVVDIKDSKAAHTTC